MNSLWGKFAQRASRSEIVYTNTPDAFHQQIANPRYEVLDFCHVSEQLDRFVVRLRPELTRAPVTNCVHIAAFVTSQARLRLYQYMEEVDRDVRCKLLYSDTDSIFYVRPIGANLEIKEGEQLGEMKREYAGRRICELVCGGPKNYAFRHSAPDATDEQVVRKVRGFQLNFKADIALGFESMRRMAFSTFNIDDVE